jgi:hypothetical protein
MTQDFLNYPLMIDSAMRTVVRDIMRRVQAEGLPGEHHFYISFNTQFPGVKMSQQLASKYPKEITIVLQHQFWDFKVDDQQFQVTLSFGGAPEKIVAPFAALTAFADPSIKFGLQFQTIDFEQAATPELLTEDMFEAAIGDDEAEDDATKVISLDAFRKK